jgi:hypothetical protein
MEPIKRIGPPTPIDVRGTEYDLSVPLSATPSPAWRRAFQAPEAWKEPCHPSRIVVKDRSLLFTSDEALVRQWVQLIDEWIAAANHQCAERPEAELRREVVEDAEQRERQRRLQEATERYKNL